MAAVSVYYYFRVIQAMYFKEAASPQVITASRSFKVTLVVVAALIILLGIMPGILLQFLYF
jgi:NADH-quinone oxidoreductase subunit N